MAEWLIIFRRRPRGQDRIVIMPSGQKLMEWIQKHGDTCSAARIIKMEGSNE